MNHIPLVRVSAFLPFLAFLKDLGAPVGSLLAKAKIPAHQLEQTDGLIPLLSAHTVIKNAVRREGMGIMGLQVGHRTRVEELGAFGSIVRSSLTLFEALQTAQGLITALDSSVRLELESDHDQVWVRRRSLIRNNEGEQQAAQFGLLLLMNLVQTAAGKDWKPTRIDLSMPLNKEIKEFKPFAESCLHFDQKTSAFILPKTLLSRPLKSTCTPYPPDSTSLLSSAPALDLVGSLRQFIRLQLKSGYLGLPQIAAAAGMSERTLQRRLHEEGIEYSRLLEEVRFELAVTRLNDPGIKIDELARELGYNDPANFTRAFRRWSGVSPSEFRRQQQES